MAAADVYMAYEDYSIFSNLSDDDLIQLAIERSLVDLFRPSSVSSRRTTQGSSSTLPEGSQWVPSEGENVPTFQQVQGHFRAQRQAALHTQNIGAALPQTEHFSSGSQNEKVPLHDYAGEKVAMRSWGKRNGLFEVRLRPTDMPALNSAIWSNDVKRLLEIVQNGPEILSKPDKEGWIPLHEAAHYGYEECLRVLIRASPQLINKRTDMSCTPLIVAVDYENQSCVKCLLAAGAGPNIPNDLGETPLYRACENDTEEIVELLLKAGAKVSQASLEGVTPLHEAVHKNNLGMCKLLLEAGANISAKNNYGIEPLFAAAQGGGTEVLNLLVEHGANINSEANDGATALYEASKNGHEEVVKLLLSLRADLNKTTEAGLTPLHVASKNGHDRIVSLLIPHTDRAVVRRSYISPLHLAAEYDKEETLEILIEAGFDVNTLLRPDLSQKYDDRCCTALHFTVRNSNIDTASMLLEAGADPNVDAFNPLLVAVRHGNAQMVALLLEYGANVNACMPTHPTTFPGAFLFCLTHTAMFKFLLDNGCDAKACFSCVHGNNPHPPIKRRNRTRDGLLDLDDSPDEAPHSTAAQFCDMLADPLHSYWTGPIIDRLLDYTGPVKLCSRITELLESNEDWVHIKEKSKPSLCLMHLCRLRIRQQVAHQRLKRMSTLPLPRLLIEYLFYDRGQSSEVFSSYLD